MVMVRSDPDLRREMSQALWEFKQLLEDGKEPKPDGKGTPRVPARRSIGSLRDARETR